MSLESLSKMDRYSDEHTVERIRLNRMIDVPGLVQFIRVNKDGTVYISGGDYDPATLKILLRALLENT